MALLPTMMSPPEHSLAVGSCLLLRSGDPPTPQHPYPTPPTPEHPLDSDSCRPRRRADLVEAPLTPPTPQHHRRPNAPTPLTPPTPLPSWHHPRQGCPTPWTCTTGMTVGISRPAAVGHSGQAIAATAQRPCLASTTASHQERMDRPASQEFLNQKDMMTICLHADLYAKQLVMICRSRSSYRKHHGWRVISTRS